MKKNYILKFFIGLFFLFSQISNGQIISQYVETNSGTTPKGIEIWNNTDSTLDFSTNTLDILKGANGAAASVDISIESGTLGPGEVMVIGTSDMETYLTNAGLTEVTFVDKSFTFNGDDALVVQYAGIITDMFGLEGSDPGSAWFGGDVETRNSNIRLIDESDSAGSGITTGDVDGWTDPSTRFVTVSETPSTIPPGLEGFGIPPVTSIWDGSIGNSWTDGDNWSNGVPAATGHALIPNVTSQPTANSAVTLNTLTIESGASFIAQSTVSGTVTLKRNLATTNWYLVASGVSGQDIDVFAYLQGLALGSGNNLGLGDYNNSTPGWTYYQGGTSGTGDFIPGDGRAILLSATGDISFSGTMNTSDVSIGMTSNTNGFNLVGNPFPSYVAGNSNADGTNNILSINTANLIENTLWFWNQGTSSYDQINQASAAFQIAPTQGFFVSATGSVNLNITEAMQSHQDTDSFQRTTITRPEINLVMTSGTDVRDVDIYYIDGATTGFDNGYDSSIFGGVSNEFTIYTHAVANGTGRSLGIQSLPNNDFENMVIPVGIHAASGEEITISASSVNLPVGINVYLEDKNDNSYILLGDNTSFVTTLAEDLDGIGRFYLHTKTQVLSVDDVDMNNISMYKSNANNLRIVGIQNGTAKVNIYNILGKQVLQTSFTSNGAKDITLPNVSAGIYLVQLKTATGQLNQKITLD